MRRKSKANDTTATPEKARRSTRGRGRAKSPTPEEPDEQEEQQQNEDVQEVPATESVEEVEEQQQQPRARRGRRRTPSTEQVVVVTPVKRGRGRKKAEIIVEEEKVEEISQPEEIVVEEPPQVDLEVVSVQEEEPTMEPAGGYVTETVVHEEEIMETQETPIQEEAVEEIVEEIVEEFVPAPAEESNTVSEDEPIQIHPDEDESVQMEENDSRDEVELQQQPKVLPPPDEEEEETPTVKPKITAAENSEAEEGEVVDDSSEGKSEEERRVKQQASRPARKMRRITETTIRVSSEQKNSIDTASDEQIKSNDANADQNNKIANAAAVENSNNKENAPRARKRKWLTQKSTTEGKPAIISISTDSLKNIIKDVKPVPLADVKLDLTPEHVAGGGGADNNDDDDDEHIKEDERIDSPNSESLESSSVLSEKKQRKISLSKAAENSTEKSSMETDKKEKPVPKPLTPPKHKISNILFITNLVRPFTVLQLKGLLARTGKIVENGFWIDKIKSKCYVKYETEDEATETRHALHGVRWPASNPKCLHVDFGRDTDMEKAIISTMEETVTRTIKNDVVTREIEVTNTFGWSKMDAYRNDPEEKPKEVVRPVREWDLGKQRTEDKDRDRRREREREREKERDRGTRDRDRRDRRRTPEANVRRSRSLSADHEKAKKKDNEPPIRLLDDLFRKTKTTPCIYWLPLTAEQITEKEESRKKRLEELERRREAERKEREEEIKKRQHERQRRRSASRERNREKRRRSHSHKSSRSRSRSPRRRYR